MRQELILSCATLLACLQLDAAAQGNPTGVCVYNCASPTPPPQRTSPGMTAPSGAAGALGAAIGTAIGRAISGQGTQQGAPAPDPNQNAAARAYLDQWENEGPDNASASPQAGGDHGGIVAARTENVGEPDDKDQSPNATLRVVNQTTSYVTVSVDGSYGCNTAGGTFCLIPIRKGTHNFRAVRSDTGASFSQAIDVSGKEVVWSLSGS